MRAGLGTLLVAIVAAAAATSFMLRPYEPAFHHWQLALAGSAAGVFLLVQGLISLRAASNEERFAALGGLGGAALCAAIVAAAFAVGPPHMLAGSPGQVTLVGSGASVLVQFPPMTPTQLREGSSPSFVTVLTGATARELHDGETMRVNQYVLRVSSGPIAFVRAQTPNGKPVTVTQPQGGAFVSPYLLFPAASGEQRLDYFAVPPLHRTVGVTYFPFYRDETRHISIPSPFVLVQIAEENGAPLFRGATVSGKPLRGGGVRLTFLLGHYPIVSLASAPARLPYALGMMMLIGGIAGYTWSVTRDGKGTA